MCTYVRVFGKYRRLMLVVRATISNPQENKQMSVWTLTGTKLQSAYIFVQCIAKVLVQFVGSHTTSNFCSNYFNQLIKVFISNNKEAVLING